MHVAETVDSVFVIDDDEFQLALLERQLSLSGVDAVRCFTSSRDALAQIARCTSRYPIVFLDLLMPELDGVEIVRALDAADYRGALVLISGEDARVLDAVARLASAHRLNVVGYLNKPVNSDALKEILENWRLHLEKEVTVPRKPYSADTIESAIIRGEFINFYQPKVRLVDAAFVGVEALARWLHPVDGLVYPDQFISPAEEGGLIQALTARVLVLAMEQQKLWQGMGIHCGVAVNVSMDSLTQLDFPDVVQANLDHIAVSPDGLTLEITESRLMKDVLIHLDVITRLRMKRISLSIDDFGTGHSSLAQLRDLPFNELKIDRSFVHGAHRIPTKRIIVDANLQMATQLGMTVVGEGIEDRDDWQFLRERKCTLGQGYFIARPMPGDEIPDWAAKWEDRRAELLSP